MKRTLLGSSLLGIMLVAGAYWSAQPLTAAADPVGFQVVDTGGGARLLRVAITADGKLGDILRKNAQISGGFEVMDRRSLPAALLKAASFDKAQWASTGADVVIMADEGGQIRVQMFEISGTGKPTISKSYKAGDVLGAADRFMNDVVEHYTGERGVFGSRIAFVRTRRDPTVSKNIQTINMNGESPSSITSNRSLNILPSIGPGGQVVFTSYAKRNPDLWVGSAPGSEKQISKEPGLNLGGAMSPDGSTIAVALSRDGNSEIYTINAGGGIKQRLTTNPAIDGQPTWSSGGQIAFVSSRAGGPQVFRMSSGGGGEARVTKEGSYNTSPDWCQGKSCANLIVYAGRDGSNRFQIFSVDAQSGKRTTVTASPGRNLDPSWSPDGRLLAFQRDGAIVITNAEGNNNVEVARGGTTPDWGPRAPGM